MQLPVTGSAPVEFTLTTMQDFDANVVAGFPTTLCRLAAHVVAEAGALPLVRLILFSGEALYDDQRALLAEAFPNAEFRSFVYGSVDGGIIGTAVLGSDDPRVFRSLWTARCWRSSTPRPAGRSRHGPVTLHLDHLRAAVDRAGVVHNGVQVVIRRVDARDQLVLRIAGEVQDFEAVRAQVHVISPRFELQTGRGTVAPLEVEWVGALEVNPRSGKTLRLIDEHPC
ncbi:hypothetical protein C8D87_10359 [Lentzea atacamensis]|uniref:FIST C domain-containing protein n=1 Tax=Lentzea atacamensis TaxID=531938 RepID=A0ABX9EC96_9PSEU|nr:hypothetical protein [Lentzea atacamensis]RAS66720.1 hypothetical protein C8D87_10359 [Lentzea atacamensis]